MKRVITISEAVSRSEKVSAPNAAISITRLTLTEAGKAALSGARSHDGEGEYRPQRQEQTPQQQQEKSAAGGE